MAKKKIEDIPNYQERQELLYIHKTPPEELGRFADMLLEEDRFSEAYDYIERMDDEGRLMQFLEAAMREGDFFNFDHAARKLDMEVAPQEWEKLGDNAARNELFRYALESYRRSGNKEKAKEIINEHPDLFGPILEVDRVDALTPGEEFKEEPEPEPEPIPEQTKPVPPTQPEISAAPSTPADPEKAKKSAAAKARKKKWKKKKK